MGEEGDGGGVRGELGGKQRYGRFEILSWNSVVIIWFELVPKRMY